MNPKNILTELKRRNVYRAAVAYGVVAWFLTQLTTQVFLFFEIPNSAVRFVGIALAVGFPIAMLLLPLRIHPRRNSADRRSRSGTGEIGQHYNNQQQHPDNDEVQDPSDGTLNHWSTPVLPETGESIFQKSIAVLPFENLSDEKRKAYFADGVQDEILTDLAKIADLKVISRTSVMQYKSGGSRNLRKI